MNIVFLKMYGSILSKWYVRENISSNFLFLWILRGLSWVIGKFEFAIVKRKLQTMGMGLRNIRPGVFLTYPKDWAKKGPFLHLVKLIREALEKVEEKLQGRLSAFLMASIINDEQWPFEGVAFCETKKNGTYHFLAFSAEAATSEDNWAHEFCHAIIRDLNIAEIAIFREEAVCHTLGDSFDISAYENLIIDGLIDPQVADRIPTAASFESPPPLLHQTAWLMGRKMIQEGKSQRDILMCRTSELPSLQSLLEAAEGLEIEYFITQGLKLKNISDNEADFSLLGAERDGLLLTYEELFDPLIPGSGEVALSSLLKVSAFARRFFRTRELKGEVIDEQLIQKIREPGWLEKNWASIVDYCNSLPH